MSMKQIMKPWTFLSVWQFNAWLLPALLLALIAKPARALEGMIRIHDPSTVITCDGHYYVYGTGRGISVLTSSNGFDWERGGRVFDRIPDSVLAHVPKNDGQGVWAPDVIRLNGGYYIYYAVSSWGSFVSAVGLVTSPTLDPKAPDYHWTDRGMVVHSVEGEALNAIDPGVCLAPDGRLWICYGSYHGAIQLVELDPKTGLRIATNSPVYIIATDSEASDIIYHDGYYYLFVNHGSCCSGDRSTYNVRVGRSVKVTGPYLDRHGEDLVQGGGTLFLAAAGKQIGPGHFGRLIEDGVEKFSCHYEADLEHGGRSVLDIRPLLWMADGWPSPGYNLREGVYQIRSQWTGTVLAAATNSESGQVQTARYLVHTNQLWRVTAAGGGWYKVSDAADGRALTGGGAVRVAPFMGAAGQLWRIDGLTDGSYQVASVADQKVLTATVKTKPGNGVALAAFQGDDTQRWAIVAP